MTGGRVGKSTLVNDVLYRTLSRDLHLARTVPGRHPAGSPAPTLSTRSSMWIKGPIGRTPRSNPATYTGVRSRSQAVRRDGRGKVRGYQPGRFSFNVKGGRCEACSGDGNNQDRNELPARCCMCRARCVGARVTNRETLEVHYKGQDDRRRVGYADRGGSRVPSQRSLIARHLQTLVDVGPDTCGSVNRHPRCLVAKRNGSNSARNCRSARRDARFTC